MSSPPINSQWFSKSERSFVEVIDVNEENVTFKNVVNLGVKSKSVDDFLKLNKRLTLDTSLHGGIPKVCSYSNLESNL